MMRLLPQEFARREAGAVEVRGDALRLGWIFDDLVTHDSHKLRVRFSCSASIADTAPDRKMFCEMFLGDRDSATVENVQRHFESPLRAAAVSTAAELPAGQWVADQASRMQSALAAAAQPIAFACGLEILPPFQIEMFSLSLERSRIETAERARAEERVAGQVQHFQRAGELLKQFQTLQEQMPQLSPGALLAQMNPVDRGSTLQSLLMASATAGQRQALWAVAGPHLIRIEGAEATPQTELMSPPTDAGPLRSVQPATINGRRVLLIGARTGVMMVPPDSPSEARVFLDSTVQSQLGFNRAVAREGEIWASHGEAGVVGWKLDRASEPFARFSTSIGSTTDNDPGASPPPPVPMSSMGGSPSLITAGSRSSRSAGPRNLQVLDEEHLVYSVGNELMILRIAEEPRALAAESTAEIVAILPDERTMLVIHADSAVSVLSRDTRQIIGRQRRAGRVCAAAALPWLGSLRMLLVDTDGPIDCVGFEDSLITQYVSPHRALRIVTASTQFVAAVSSDRQRVILWNTWDGRAPLAEIHVTAKARHRVADVAFG